MCEIHTIENIRLVPCDRIRPITLLSDIPHPDMWGDARSQQKSETVAITYNRHRCKRHFIILFPCSWLHENFPTTRKREITSLHGLSLGDATSQAMGAKSCLRLFRELSTNSRTTHFWSVTGRIVHGGLNYMNDDDNQRPATHLNCGYAFLVSLLAPNDYLCFNFIIPYRRRKSWHLVQYMTDHHTACAASRKQWPLHGLGSSITRLLIRFRLAKWLENFRQQVFLSRTLGCKSTIPDRDIVCVVWHLA